MFNTEGEQIKKNEEGLVIEISNRFELEANLIINSTYSQINILLHKSSANIMALQHKIAEIALVKVPEEIKDLGITLMDGPFFSIMPFPAESLHSLSHVRYTHHEIWEDGYTINRNPYQYLSNNPPLSNFAFMVKDAQRYLPVIKNIQYVKSLFEIKTLLQRNEIDAGRPILFHEHAELPGLFSVMGGKIDNVFDLLGLMKNFVKSTTT